MKRFFMLFFLVASLPLFSMESNSNENDILEYRDDPTRGLYDAIDKNDPDLVESYLKLGAVLNPEPEFEEIETPLSLSQKVFSFFGKAESKIRYRRKNTPPLWRALNGRNQKEIIALLCQYGADVNENFSIEKSSLDSKEGITPLHAAVTNTTVRQERAPIIDILLQHGAQPDAPRNCPPSQLADDFEQKIVTTGTPLDEALVTLTSPAIEKLCVPDTVAHYNPMPSQEKLAESRARVKTWLLVSKEQRLPPEIGKEILLHVPQDIFNKEMALELAKQISTPRILPYLSKKALSFSETELLYIESGAKIKQLADTLPYKYLEHIIHSEDVSSDTRNALLFAVKHNIYKRTSAKIEEYKTYFEKKKCQESYDWIKGWFSKQWIEKHFNYLESKKQN